MKKFIPDYSLYFVTSQEYSGKRLSFEIAEEAVGAGVDILQMREKNLPQDQLLELGKKSNIG